MHIRITHLGTATVILEIGSLRILTDPAFDHAGTKYSWAPIGGSSTKLEEPVSPPPGSFDAVLITHAQHDDNLDAEGRALLPSVATVLTTVPSAKRLGGHARGLREWESVELRGKDGLCVKITATPARHGPPGSLPFVGKVIGFVLEWAGQTRGSLYISGDTVFFSGIEQVAKRFQVGVALLHMGQAKLPIMGPFRLTMNGAQAAHAAQVLGAHTVVPIHYDGWTHFSEPRADAERAFAHAALTSRVRWLVKGTPTKFEM